MFLFRKSNAFVLAVLVAGFSDSVVADYRVTNLGVLGEGHRTSAALDINNAGQVVGLSMYSGPGHFEAGVPFIYSNGQMNNLIPTAFYGVATGINSNGEASVYNGYQGYLYSNGNLTNVGTLYGNTNPKAINASGHVVGISSVNGRDDHGFWYDGSTIHDVGVLPGGDISGANAVNDAGQIVGGSTTLPGSYMHAFLYVDGVMQDLGTFENGIYSEAMGINDLGVITGNASLPGDMVTHAFLYDGTMHDLGSLALNSFAQDINNNNQVVGYADGLGDLSHAFLYSGGVMMDLNSQLDDTGLGWVLTSAAAINDSGQIVGTGRYNGAERAFLLTPVPLSDSGVFMASVLLGIYMNARRRKST